MSNAAARDVTQCVVWRSAAIAPEPKMNKTCAALALACLAAAFAVDAPAFNDKSAALEAPRSVQREVGADRFVAGGSVSVDQAVSGDLIAAGGTIDVDAPVGGDALVFGGNVRIGGNVAQSVYASGGQLVIRGRVGRNARFAGGQVELAPKSQIAGNVSVGGGQVTLNGGVKGYVQAAGGNLMINGPVEGDVFASAGTLELGPDARINGRLRYASRDELKRHPAAVVTGGVERASFSIERGEREEHERARSVYPRGGWIWTVGLMVLAGVLIAALPAVSARVSTTLRARPGLSLLFGFIALVCIPVAAVVVLITVIGIPLALLALALYLPLLLIGYVAAGIGVGDWTLQRFKSDAAERLWWRIGAAATAVLLLALLARLPWVGGIVALLALLIGLGALLLQFRRSAAAG
jgi:cytoskeletal protein CcmA (bactofilin family)